MKLKAFLFSLILSAPAFAGGAWTNVTVTHVYPLTTNYLSPNGGVEVALSGSSVGGPSCSSANKAFLVIDISTAAGRFAAAAFQSAFLSGATLPSIGGAGNCNLMSGIESLSYVQE